MSHASSVRSSKPQHLSLETVTTLLIEKFEMIHFLFLVPDVEGVEQSGDAPARGLHCEESLELY